MEKREKRRDLTIRIGESRRKQHLSQRHATGPVDCVCEFSAWRFAKRPGLGCEKCRNKRHGNPKLGMGPCSELIRSAVVQRREGKRHCKEWRELLTGTDPDDIEI